MTGASDGGAPVRGAPVRGAPGKGADLFRFERALARRGFTRVAGVDEAGRGAAAGPLVVAAVILPGRAAGRPAGIAELRDSKLLAAAARERVHDRIVDWAAAWAAVVIEADEVDRLGLHRANIEGMRRALARLQPPPDYVLSDGFSVPGSAAPNLGMWKGDEVAACVAAAGVVAKVTRDRIMARLHEDLPEYGFDVHKGYLTSAHRARLAARGPSPAHRRCFAPVRHAASGGRSDPAGSAGDDGRQGRVFADVLSADLTEGGRG